MLGQHLHQSLPQRINCLPLYTPPMRPQHRADRLVLQTHHIHQPPIRDVHA